MAGELWQMAKDWLNGLGVMPVSPPLKCSATPPRTSTFLPVFSRCVKG